MYLADSEELRRVQQSGVVDLLTTLRSVEINPIDFCNRTCNFCPRSRPDLYPNSNKKISIDLVEKIAQDLIDINYNGRVGFVGYGEPLAYRDLAQAVSIIRATSAQWIEVSTNGDFLNRKMIEDLHTAGCTHIAVSMYDRDISDVLIDMASGIDITIVPRHYYPTRFDMKVVNRIEILDPAATSNPVQKACYLPFYKMFIDYTGDVLICDNDWGRNGVLGNIQHASVKDVWLSDNAMMYRQHLRMSDRASCKPCNKCNVDGTLYGRDSFVKFNEVL